MDLQPTPIRTSEHSRSVAPDDEMHGDQTQIQSLWSAKIREPTWLPMYDYLWSLHSESWLWFGVCPSCLRTWTLRDRPKQLPVSFWRIWYHSYSRNLAPQQLLVIFEAPTVACKVDSQDHKRPLHRISSVASIAKLLHVNAWYWHEVY